MNTFTHPEEGLVMIYCDCCDKYLGTVDASEYTTAMEKLHFCSNSGCDLFGCSTERLKQIKNPPWELIDELRSRAEDDIINPPEDGVYTFPQGDDIIPF